MTAPGTGPPPPPPGVSPPPPGVNPPPPAGSPPPPGPGVRPPFAAAPTDGTRRRRWWAVGLAAAVALICCVGGITGASGLVVFGGRMQMDAARTTVTDYLGAIQQQKYVKAYGLLCASRRQEVSEPQFVDSVSTWNFTSFDVGTPEFTTTVAVPVTLRFDNHTPEGLRFYLGQDKSTGEFRVCGQAR